MRSRSTRNFSTVSGDVNSANSNGPETRGLRASFGSKSMSLAKPITTKSLRKSCFVMHSLQNGVSGQAVGNGHVKATLAFHVADAFTPHYGKAIRSLGNVFMKDHS